MALSHEMSGIVSLIMSVGVFSGMQFYRHQLASSGPLTILGGGLGSVLFLFILTAVGNIEISLFGKGYQTSLFPEIVPCLVLALIASGRVHGVCITTCFLFSLVTLYYVNRISHKTYGHGAAAATVNPAAQSSHKKKNK
ncbi:Protein KRTCAP2 [Orchesella cincta]|uniref:Protein KRTCAP2 n=1 Tax=Orchesella cincta TaxID=48709 RepID=A0A1D2N231_ORCCI|nr:Protein KRTCAP2 [Orchesella cincta]